MGTNKENNYCIIMCGGIGSHFWPFSCKSKPKQFLDFMGTGYSLLQHSYQRFNHLIPTDHMFVVTNNVYADLVRKQLPELKDSQILLEPTRRNTAPCIAWATYHIYALNPNANIVVAPCDHLIMNEVEFQNIIKKGLDFTAESESLLTIGIKPNRPETEYGYIQVADEQIGDAYKVKTFTEKPQEELAQVFLETGEFYWNSGLFIWNATTILAAFEKYLPELSAIFDPALKQGIFGSEKEQEYIDEHFPACPNISIDFGVMEKTNKAYVLLGDFGWSDLSSWNALDELSQKDELDNVTINCEAITYNSYSNLIALPKGKVAVLQDMEGYLIAESDKVLVICKKEDTQTMRNTINEILLKYGDEYM